MTLNVQSPPGTVKQTALLALEAGISVLPVPANGTKFPSFLTKAKHGETWESYQTKRSSRNQLEKWLIELDKSGICFICGAISHNLEAFDFDNAGFFQKFKQAAYKAGLGGLVEKLEKGYCEKTPNGYHLLYRCTDPVAGNAKLALVAGEKGPKAVIETRGEGGLVVVAPSSGKVHPGGGSYRLLRGGVDTIATISFQERRELFNLARSLTELPLNFPEAEVNRQTPTQLERIEGLRPGDDFNRQANWAEILEPHGWRMVSTSGSKTSWCRPGKNRGVSATTDYETGLDGKLYVFSTSTVFEAEKAYNKFAAYSLLNHQGDFARAAAALLSQGYGGTNANSEKKKIPADRIAIPEGVALPPLITNSAAAATTTQENKPDSSASPPVTTASSTKPKLTTVNAEELVATEFEPIRWVVADILPEGTSMLAAHPKIGKSWLALNLALAVASGGLALGCKPVEKGQVLYLALEDTPRRMKTRIQKLVGPLKVPSDLEIAFEWPRSDEGGCLALEEWLLKHTGARLVIVDTFAKFKKLHTKSENLYEADYNALQGLKRMADYYRVAILVIHHTRKAKSEDPLEEISGSTGLTAGLDNTLTLRRVRGETEAVLYIIGRDIEGDQELALNFDAQFASWQLLGPAQERAISQERKEIIELLAQFPAGLRPLEIAKELGKNRDTVRQTLRRMYQEGQLNKDGQERYVPAIMSHTGAFSPNSQSQPSAVMSHSGHSGHSSHTNREVGISPLTTLIPSTPTRFLVVENNSVQAQTNEFATPAELVSATSDLFRANSSEPGTIDFEANCNKWNDPWNQDEN